MDVLFVLFIPSQNVLPECLALLAVGYNSEVTVDDAHKEHEVFVVLRSGEVLSEDDWGIECKPDQVCLGCEVSAVLSDVGDASAERGGYGGICLNSCCTDFFPDLVRKRELLSQSLDPLEVPRNELNIVLQQVFKEVHEVEWK